MRIAPVVWVAGHSRGWATVPAISTASPIAVAVRAAGVPVSGGASGATASDRVSAGAR